MLGIENTFSMSPKADPSMTRPARLSIITATVMVITATVCDASEPAAEQINLFEKKVRPLLAKHCFECHTGDTVENDLQLDSLAAMLRGGLRGAAIVPGKPDESLLVSAIRHGEILKMPPKRKLAAREIAVIEAWVKMGAPWPNAKPLAETAEHPENDAVLFTDEQKSFWAFQCPVEPLRPRVSDGQWSESAIDDFILHELDEAGLSTAPPTDKRTLIRRAKFDLVGLPPTPDEVDAFLADQSPQAFAKVVDRMLGSPLYGERWGRRWLDVARYADSNGLDENLAYANAYHFRDYVIACFNKDKPYNQFIQEQIAGDLLPATDDPQAATERVAATGFLSLGAKMLAEDDPVKMQMDIIDEQVDTVGRAFMGLSLGCARCHDHKFDPISTADYYSLAGIFKSTKTMEHFKVVARWQERPLAPPEVILSRDEHEQQIVSKQAEIDAAKSEATAAIVDHARQHVGEYLLAAHELLQREEMVRTATVLGNIPEATSKPGVTLIEAEDFARGNVSKDFSTFGESIGVLVDKGERPNFVEYDVEMEDAGLVQLEFRYSAGDLRPCKLVINGELVRRDAAGELTGGFYPEHQKWMVQGFLELKAGKNIIRLEHPLYFPHIDKLLIANAPDNVRELARFEPLSDYEPFTELVRQWFDYLERTKPNEDSVFAVWHAFVAGSDLPANSSASAVELLKDTSPPTTRDLAIRYQEVFAHASDSHPPNGTDEPDRHDPLDSFRKVLDDPKGPFAKPESIEAHFAADAVASLKQLRDEKKQLGDSLPILPETMAVIDGTIEDIRIHIRGSHLTQADIVLRRLPRILAGEDQVPIGDTQSGRLQLANWIASASHPLTARVMVNRIWQGHFGEGLVRTPDNFGRLGERPTHPELLDWLALRFVESGWSLKAMHRLIMLSSTYQMSTAWNERAAEADPDNKLWWRMNRRRLEAEAIRDSVLAMGGSLDLSMGGTILPTANREYVTSTTSVDPVAYQPKRRSVYLPVIRSALYDVFQAFDFADPSMLNGQRQSTTVAAQALFMMNSRIVSEQTRALAVRLLGDENLDDAGRIQQTYLQALSRPPSDREISRGFAYLDQYLAALTETAAGSNTRLLAWQSLCRAIIATNEFIYVE